MKKWFIFIFFLALNERMEASYVHKACKGLVSALTAYPLYTFYKDLKSLRDAEAFLNHLQDVNVYLGPKKAALLNGYLNYQLPKPLKIGISQLFAEDGLAHSTQSTNYITVGYKFAKVPSVVGIKHGCENSYIADYYENMPDDKFLMIWEPIVSILKHEIGHLVHEDQQNMQQYMRDKIYKNIAILSCFNAYLATRALSQPHTKLGLMAKAAMIMGATIFSKVDTNLRLAQLSQKQESLADDFAITHATSIEELEYYKLSFEKYALPMKTKKSDLPEFAQKIISYVSSHPTPESRIEKVEKAIKNWKF